MQISQFLLELRRRVAALPGVDYAVSTDVALLSGGNRSDGFTVTGHAGKDAVSTFADLYMTTPRLFRCRWGRHGSRAGTLAMSRQMVRSVAIINKAFRRPAVSGR